MPEPKMHVTDADLELLLARGRSRRPDPERAAHEDAGEPRESLDSQILAGLVSP